MQYAINPCGSPISRNTFNERYYLVPETVLHIEASMPAREFPMSEMIHERCSR